MCVCVYVCGGTGMSRAVWCEEFLRPRRSAVLRDALPRAPWLSVCDVQQAGDGPMRDCHVPQVPPGALRVHLLPATTQQGNVQGAEQQAVLSAVLRPVVQLRAFIRLLILYHAVPNITASSTQAT